MGLLSKSVTSSLLNILNIFGFVVEEQTFQAKMIYGVYSQIQGEPLNFFLRLELFSLSLIKE